MIDDKKIEEAASAYEKKTQIECEKLNEKLNSGNGFSVTYKSADAAFIDGAKWAINEFLKGLWHPVSEEPKREAQRTYILGMTRASESGVLPMLLRQNTDWKEFSLSRGVTRWLYIDDLLPKKGGQQ